MDEERHRARLVDTGALGGRSITATLPRREVEEALSTEQAPRLVLDVERRAGDEVEAHALSVEFTREELDELLGKSGDEVTFAFDADELERALEDDVEAHGLREKALLLTVAAATAGGFAGQAAAHTEFGSSPAAVVAPATSQVVSDASTGGGYGAQAAASSQLVSDASTGGGYGAPAAASSSELVSDAASGGGYEAPAAAASSSGLVSDAASGGGYEAPTAAVASSPSGTSIDSQDVRDAAIGGGIVLLITGAGFLIRGQRRGAPRPV
jgi:hypothetical protein